MKFLVTGSRGYIGSTLCKLLQLSGHEVHGVDIDGSPSGSTIYGMFTEANINDYSVAVMAQALNVDAVFHLAASADVGLSMKAPELFYYNNTGNTAALITNLIDVGWHGRIIFSSTAAVYKEQFNKVFETSPVGSPNPYGRSKYACEQLLHDVYAAHGIDVTIFRYFNVSGAWDDVGDHMHTSHIISRLCDTVYHNHYFTLNGDQRPTPDGTCIRDYLHVRDVCEAHLHAYNYMLKHPGVHTFNLGTGIGNSNLDIINAFTRFTGSKPLVSVGPRRLGDPDRLVAGADKFINDTGFRYQYSNLENIITSAWTYFRNKMES